MAVGNGKKWNFKKGNIPEMQIKDLLRKAQVVDVNQPPPSEAVIDAAEGEQVCRASQTIYSGAL